MVFVRSDPNRACGLAGPPPFPGFSDPESFNGKLRDELLNGEIFYSLAEAAVPAAKTLTRRQFQPEADDYAAGARRTKNGFSRFPLIVGCRPPFPARCPHSP